MNRQLIRKGLITGVSLALLTPLGGLQELHAAGTPGAGEEALPPGQSADQVAVQHYRNGLAHKEAALEKTRVAAQAADAAERAALEAAAQTEYRLAVQAQGKALKLHLTYYEAANELGYALRQSGDYRKALGAYNFALQIKPDFYPAIEYRGEAYLALGMLDEAKQAYMTLFQNDLPLAATLLEAMEAAQDTDPAFRAWVAERRNLAAMTTDNPAGAHWQSEQTTSSL